MDLGTRVPTLRLWHLCPRAVSQETFISEALSSQYRTGHKGLLFSFVFLKKKWLLAKVLERLSNNW